MQISEKQNKASGEIVDLIANSIGRNREVHTATAIATAGRLSGTFLFKSFGLDLQESKPGTVVLSQQANQEGPELINVIGVVLSKLNVPVDNEKMASAEVQESKLDFSQTIKATFLKASEIMKTHGLSEKEMAAACAIATGFIIQQCQTDLNVESGFTTAIYGLIEGSKTVPPPLSNSTNEQKRWYKFW